MTNREFSCSSILTDLIENDGLIGVKTSFEDEGAQFNEIIRLKEICNQSKTKLTLKIGGPEAVRDIKDSLIIGVKGIVAPMVESPFGLQKFVQAAKQYITSDVLSSTHLSINIETITSISNIEDIINHKSIENLYGITIGRVDLVSSMSQNRSYVNSKEVLEIVKKCFKLAKSKGLKLCIGGAISVESLDFLNSLHMEGLLDKFETRYAIFDPSVALKNLPRALSRGQKFEYEWLQCKHDYYHHLANQDSSRIKMIQDRINQSIDWADR
jgi:hypothetical protein